MTAARAGGAGDAETVEVVLDGFAHGGEAVGRLPDGRACFVGYGIPGERVVVAVTEQRRRWARGTVTEVVEASPDRVTPPCPLFGPGRCGGCRLQHIAVDRQRQLLGEVIADQVRRIGRLEIPGGAVEMIGPHGDDGLGYRNRARFAVTAAGRLAFRRARSHDTIAVDDCPLLTAPAREQVRTMAEGWRDVAEVGLHVGTDGAAALDVATAGPDPVVPSPLPARRTRVGRRGRDGAPHVHHDVAGHRLRAGVGSFFQASVAAAEVLVGLVVELTPVRPGDHVVDCYAGVGLFSVALAARGARVTAIESSAAACADARVNAAALPISVVRADVASAPVRGPVAAVVLDPPRAGAGTAALQWIAARRPTRITYVSCDPATFARDARQLDELGYRLDRLVGVDQFTHTGHVELVGGFAGHS